METIESKGLSGRTVGVETVDKMTDPQIEAKARKHFLKKSPPSGYLTIIVNAGLFP
jgi:hypothetical protein